MFKQSDFDLPLEMSLKLRVICDEIDNCDNKDELKKQLKDAVRLAMSYQNLLALTVKEVIANDVEKWFADIDKIKRD